MASTKDLSYNCYTIGKSVLFYFVHRLYFNEITMFRKLNLLPSSGKKGRTKTLAAGPPGWSRLKTWSSSRPDKNIIHSHVTYIFLYSSYYQYFYGVHKFSYTAFPNSYTLPFIHSFFHEFINLCNHPRRMPICPVVWGLPTLSSVYSSI
jgi:hypothetical protein